MAGTSASGRRRLPQAIKVLRGTVDPRWTNDAEPQAGVDLLQFIPDELSEGARKYWATLRPQLVDAGIAINTDRAALIDLCETWASYLDSIAMVRKSGIVIKGPNGHPVKNPFFEASNQLGERLRRLLVEFGMTPSSRSKITSAGRKPGKKAGEFDL